jgi:hypothetical protein
VPIGDIEVEGGGLVYLNGSQDIGRKYEEDFSRLNETLSDADKISAVNKNMNAGGWLDRNLSKFGKYWGRDWLVVGALMILFWASLTAYRVHTKQEMLSFTTPSWSMLAPLMNPRQDASGYRQTSGLWISPNLTMGDGLSRHSVTTTLTWHAKSIGSQLHDGRRWRDYKSDVDALL